MQIFFSRTACGPSCSQTTWERLAGIQRNKNWYAKYAEAYDAYLAGDLEVEFPYGTDWMRKYARGNVARLPP